MNQERHKFGSFLSNMISRSAGLGKKKLHDQYFPLSILERRKCICAFCVQERLYERQETSLCHHHELAKLPVTVFKMIEARKHLGVIGIQVNPFINVLISKVRITAIETQDTHVLSKTFVNPSGCLILRRDRRVLIDLKFF